MEYCTNCRSKIKKDDKFCEKCGHRVGAPSSISVRTPSATVKNEKPNQTMEWLLPAIIICIVLVGALIAFHYSGEKPETEKTTLSTWPFSTGSSPAPTPAISNPDYLKNPSGYLVDYEDTVSTQIPRQKALWVEEIKSSTNLKVSFTVVKEGRNILVFRTISIPGLMVAGFPDSDSEGSRCKYEEAVSFLNRKLLHTEVYLTRETRFPGSSGVWRMLMPVSHGNTETMDVAAFVISEGYGRKDWTSSYNLDGYEEDVAYMVGLEDKEDVAKLAKKGFWGKCQGFMLK